MALVPTPCIGNEWKWLLICLAFVKFSLILLSVCRIRVQAVNAIGIGSFSPTLKCSTQPLPPAPPSLECILVSHNHLKLRWGDGRNLDFIHYSVEMQEEDGKE